MAGRTDGRHKGVALRAALGAETNVGAAALARAPDHRAAGLQLGISTCTHAGWSEYFPDDRHGIDAGLMGVTIVCQLSLKMNEYAALTPV